MSERTNQTIHTLTKQIKEPACILYHSICDKFRIEQNEFMVSEVMIQVILWWGFVEGTDSGNMGTHRVSSGYLDVFTM